EEHGRADGINTLVADPPQLFAGFQIITIDAVRSGDDQLMCSSLRRVEGRSRVPLSRGQLPFDPPAYPPGIFVSCERERSVALITDQGNRIALDDRRRWESIAAGEPSESDARRLLCCSLAIYGCRRGQAG